MILNLVILMLAAVNISGFIVVAIDKYKARKRLWRVPEKVFFFLSLLGGCLGVYLSLLLFRHKTKHPTFMIGIPAIFIIQVFAVLYFYL